MSTTILCLYMLNQHDRVGDMRNDLRKARLARKMTQESLAEKIGKDQAYVSRLENGEYRIDVDIAPAVAKALRLPLMRVLYGDKP